MVLRSTGGTYRRTLSSDERDDPMTVGSPKPTPCPKAVRRLIRPSLTELTSVQVLSTGPSPSLT